MPPYFFHKNIIPKELVMHFVQRYHSTEFNKRLVKTVEYLIETQACPASNASRSTQLRKIRACSILLLK